MRRLKPILYAALFGAVVGAAVMRLRGNTQLQVSFLERDRELLVHGAWFYSAVALYLVLSLYWEIAAKDAAAARSTESTASRFLHVFLANIAVVLVLAPIHGLGRLWAVSVPVMVAGLAVEAFGCSVALWARRVLGRNWSGRIAINEGHELVRSGPYKLLRHPIYTGFLVMAFGAALVTGERLAIPGLLLLLFAYWRKVRLEEANLTVAFGTSYDDYRRETWALLPGLF